MPVIVSKYLLTSIWNCCAVLFESEQTPFPWKGCWFISAALHRIRLWASVLFQSHIFAQRPMTDLKIEQSDACCFGLQQLLANSIKNFISHVKKMWLFTAQNLQTIKTVLTLELSQYLKSGGMFFLKLACCCPLGNSLWLCLPIQQAQECWRAAPRAWQLIQPSKPSITFWNSLQRDCQVTNLNSVAWPTGCKDFISSKI